MASDLTRFRDHCRQMANDPAYPSRRWLWLQLADEIDAYLAGPDDVVDLWGNPGIDTLDPALPLPGQEPPDEDT